MQLGLSPASLLFHHIFFPPWNISNIPISSVYSLTGIGSTVSTPVGLTGRHAQFAGNNPYCGKSKSSISCLRCRSWGCRSTLTAFMHRMPQRRTGSDVCRPASYTSPFHVMYQTHKYSQTWDTRTLGYYLLQRMLS